MKIDHTEFVASLRSESAPLSYAKLKKVYVNKKAGIPEAELLETLSAAIRSGSIFAWPKKSYWHVDPEAQLRAEILSACAAKALKRTEIKVKGRTSKDIGIAIEGLLAEGRLLKYPALSGAAFLLLSASSPDAYWVYVKDFVTQKLKKAGIAEAGLEEEILKHLEKLEPDKDLPVSVVRLREALSSPDKRHFDEAVLKLRAQQRVHLSQHDDPHGLTAEDREALIDGKDGKFYVAISRRER
jgi:hypothetical protein